MVNGNDMLLDSIIIERLGERQKKIDRITEMERMQKSAIRMRRVYIGLAVAACALALIVFAPFKSASPLEELGIEYSPTEYRAATPELAEISGMIEKKDYYAALLKTQNLLHHSDLVIDELGGVAEDWDDEELLYEMQQEMMLNSEIRWTYIYLLVQSNKNKEAIKELKLYLKYKDFCEHEQDAQSLLKLLKGKK